MNELRALANHLDETGEEENLEIVLRKMEALSSQTETEQPVPPNGVEPQSTAPDDLPEWRMNEIEYEKRPWYDIEDAATQATGFAKEGLAGIADVPVNLARAGAEAIDQNFDTDLAQYPEAAQDYLDDSVREARIERGDNPNEWSGARSVGKVAAEIALTRKIPGFSGAFSSVGSIFQRAKQMVQQGMGIGMVEGATNYRPQAGEDYSFRDLGESTAKGAVVGGVTGGAGMAAKPIVNTVARGVTKAKRGADTLKHKWKHGATDPGNIANKVVGEKNVKQKIKDLRRPENNDPSRPLTAGEATAKSNNPEFAALQKESESLMPQRAVEVHEKTDGLGEKAIRTIIGKGTEKTRKIRTEASRAHYKAALKDNTTPVDVSPVVKTINSLRYLNRNTEQVTNPLDRILKTLEPDLVRVGKSGQVKDRNLTVQGMKSASENIDSMLKETSDGIVKYDQGMLMKIQKKLDDQIGKASLDYKKANDLWRRNSKAVNRAEAGEELLAAYRTSLSDLPARKIVFANLVKKYGTKIHPKTGKKILGSLTPKMQQSLAEVLDIMSRQVRLDKMGQLGRRSMTERALPPEWKPTGMFSPILSVARGVVNRHLVRRDKEAKLRLAKMMLSGDNKALAKEMEKALTPVQTKEIKDFLTYQIEPLLATYGGAASSSIATTEDKKDRVNKFISKDK